MALLLLAALLGRVDLVAIAVPFAVGTALSLLRRPTQAPVVRWRLPTRVVAEGQALDASVVVTAEERLSVVTTTVHTGRWLGVVGGVATRSVAMQPGEEAEVPARVRALRWGRHVVGPAVVHAAACDGLLVCDPVIAAPQVVSVLPRATLFTATELVPRAVGMVGRHRSRRPGDSGELAGVRPFTTGDRLRRIDWRVSLREQQMYVSATLSERDTDVVVVMDVLHDAGGSGGIDGAPSSLDTTVRATAALAEHYLGSGDSVSVVEYGARLRFIPRAAGRNQLRRILDWLLDVRVVGEGAGASSRLLGPRVLPPRALTIVLTPLLEERSTQLLAVLAQRGHDVVAVDTLPPDARPDLRGPWVELAWRLWQLEREAVLGRLREVGVPVVRWEGPGSLDAVLRDVTRMAGGVRAGR